MTSLDCSIDVNLLFVLIKYTKMSYFVPFGYIAVVGIQVEKPRGNFLVGQSHTAIYYNLQCI